MSKTVKILIIVVAVVIFLAIIYFMFKPKTAAATPTPVVPPVPPESNNGNPWIGFDWIGGQTCSGNNVIGVHLVNFDPRGKINVGDTVEIQSPKYNGKFTMCGVGDDSSERKWDESVIRINTPNVGSTPGLLRKA